MSLDCYPFGKRQTIGLSDQPMSVDVAYDDNLVICVLDNCQSIVVYDLEARHPDEYLIRKFQLGQDVVIDQIVYCKKGDYIACVGHSSNGSVSLYTVFDWRNDERKPRVEQLNDLLLPKQPEKPNLALNCIDACQRTGNLVVSFGDVVHIYNYQELATDTNNVGWSDKEESQRPTTSDGYHLDAESAPDDRSAFTDSLFSQAETVRNNPNCSSTEDLTNDLAELGNDAGASGDWINTIHFSHLITLELSIWALKVSLVENYLSIMAVDHVQVFKLELLTLQLQAADTTDCAELGLSMTNQSSAFLDPNGLCRGSRNDSKFGPGLSDVASACGDAATSESSSMVSDNSISTATNFSAYQSDAHQSETSDERPRATDQSLLDNSDLSIITMSNNHLLDQTAGAASLFSLSRDDCLTWNLNTKKLVKLPTLMHNTSNSWSSFHICHPLELLGPASESIACRVIARIYSQHYSQNQLEPVVMLCKQFDFDRDPVKSARLEAIYLASSTSGLAGSNEEARLVRETGSCCNPLKSADYESLATINCFVSTLSSCFVYALQGKKVQRLQIITHPDLCLDLRPDLLNVYILTPLGLQICSTGVCDSQFRYDWSSSADLNLSFVAHVNRTRCLTTRKHALFIVSTAQEAPSAGSSTAKQERSEPKSNDQQAQVCQIEALQKPNLLQLSQRIVHTVQRCQSVSVRSNLLSFLHATAQLHLMDLIKQANDSSSLPGHNPEILGERQRKTVELVREIAVLLCKQLIQKKQTNVITNCRIDRAIKNLLDASHCDLGELMRRHLGSSSASNERKAKENQLGYELANQDDLSRGTIKFASLASGLNESQTQLANLSAESTNGDEEEKGQTGVEARTRNRSKRAEGQLRLGDDEGPQNLDFELIRICLKHSKFNQGVLSYIRSRAVAGDQAACERVLAYLYDYNPRLLIKCAQRFFELSPEGSDGDEKEKEEETASASRAKATCLGLLIKRLKQLAEFDSTGINRATVLFTLAILYNVQEDRAACLAALGQIKPHNHLAITMCSNFEAISNSMAITVQENFPEVYGLFLTQLARRNQAAGCRFSQLNRPSGDGAMANPSSGVESGVGREKDDSEASEDDEEQLEKRLRLVADIPALELADLLSSTLDSAGSPSADDEDREAIRAYLKASINLLESRFILARLCENPSH